MYLFDGGTHLGLKWGFVFYAIQSLYCDLSRHQLFRYNYVSRSILYGLNEYILCFFIK